MDSGDAGRHGLGFSATADGHFADVCPLLLADAVRVLGCQSMGMEKLKLLMSYTTFHIGLYTTLGAALVAFLGTGRAGPMKPEARPVRDGS